MNAQRIVDTKRIAAALACAWLACLPSLARAQLVIQDTFTGGHSSLDASYGGTAWINFIGACLTAGDGTGSIPACKGLSYYGSGQSWVGGQNGTLPDTSGNGALRFTNGCTGSNCDGNFTHGFNQAGGIVSNFTYPTSAGLQVTFTTMTYEGDSGGGNSDGADGISFFLLNGSASPYDLGAFGGSLGYTCSNTNNDPRLHPDSTPRQYDGIIGAYLGLGIDEYGNFLNQGDNTATGYGYQPNRIGLRGAGSISWSYLKNHYPTQYPSTLSLAGQASAVQATCVSGLLQDYSAYSNSSGTGGKTYKNSSNQTVAIADYAPIPNAYQVLPVSTFKIANESATKRTQGVPIAYKLKISSAGLLSFSYSYNGGATQSVITNQDITAGNGALPASFRFGFAGSTGGSTNVHEVLCFNAAPADTAGSSAGLNEKQTAKVQTGSQVYFAYYNPSNWSGSLTAQNLAIDSVTGLVSIASPAVWDASCVLSGVPAGQTCIATNVAGPTTAQGPSSRSILTWNGSSGVPLQYGASPGLSGTQMTAIDLGDSNSNTPPVAPGTADRVNYLRGDRSNEQNSAGVGEFRPRASVLGDIIDSSPTWVGPPAGPYKASWTDKIGGAASPENSGTTYTAFQAAAATRLNTVWSGANDGLLHGFGAGSYAADGVTYVDNATTPNNGREVLAYMPAAVVTTIHNSTTTALDFSHPKYGHNFFVDAPPGTGDLYYGTTWHTWVVGGLGPGGGAIYALDVTDPTTFSEGNAANLVKGEWNNTSAAATGGISCVGATTCYKSLGNTYGVPQIRRFHNGMWGAVFGNGFGSVNGDAGIFIMLVNPSDATGKTIQFYYLPSGGSTSGNGIAYTTPADLDGDHIVDYVYAGDLKGNVWRFDVTSSNPASWAVSSGGPLFTTPGGQPITTKLAVVATPNTSGAQRILVDFGTGQQVPLTNSTPVSYASGAQSLYGVWDWNLGTWNAKGSTQYASLGSSYGTYTISTSNLQQQTLTVLLSGSGTSSGYESVSSNPVCWYGSTTCGSGNTQFGWYINLPNSNEQIIYSPVIQAGAFIVNTTIPAAASIYNCVPANATGWTIAISPTTGASFTKSFFGDSGGHFVNYNGQIVSGVALSGTGSVSVVTTSGTTTGTFLVTQTSSGIGTVLPINPLATATGSRLTWLERR
jgi:type IV pilus assembly protein PilY1